MLLGEHSKKSYWEQFVVCAKHPIFICVVRRGKEQEGGRKSIELTLFLLAGWTDSDELCGCGSGLLVAKDAQEVI